MNNINQHTELINSIYQNINIDSSNVIIPTDILDINLGEKIKKYIILDFYHTIQSKNYNFKEVFKIDQVNFNVESEVGIHQNFTLNILEPIIVNVIIKNVIYNLVSSEDLRLIFFNYYVCKYILNHVDISNENYVVTSELYGNLYEYMQKNFSPYQQNQQGGNICGGKRVIINSILKQNDPQYYKININTVLGEFKSIKNACSIEIKYKTNIISRNKNKFCELILTLTNEIFILNTYDQYMILYAEQIAPFLNLIIENINLTPQQHKVLKTH